MFCGSQLKYLTCLSKVVCMFYTKKNLLARSPAGSSGETAGKAAAVVGEEVRTSAYGRSTVSSLRNGHVTLCSPKVRNRPTNLSLSSVPVWRRRAVCSAERRADRQDVRLSPWSFLQLLPAEVLMSSGRLVVDGQCSRSKRTLHQGHHRTPRFY